MNNDPECRKVSVMQETTEHNVGTGSYTNVTKIHMYAKIQSNTC